MSVDLLLHLQQEVRRLFVAGSALAEGDLRLSKMVPSLRRIGESAPVFNRLADAAEGLLFASQADSSAKLLELSTLLSAILHTQGKTDVQGNPQPVESEGLQLSTDLTYRRLYPLLIALTTKGQGRLEQLRQSFEDRSFLDLRVVPAICGALDDVYAEIPDFVQEKMIPEIGEAAIPVLRAGLNLQGGKGDARRLKLLYQLKGDSVLELVKQAGSAGTTDLKIAAIELLGSYSDQEGFLLEQSSEKRREVRQTAFYALARLGSPKAIDRLLEAAMSKGGELVIEPIQSCDELELHRRIILKAEQELSRYIELEGKDRVSAIGLLYTYIRCLKGRGHALAGDALPLVKRLLHTEAFIVADTEAVQEAAAELLLELNIEEADEFGIELHTRYKRKFIGYSFQAAYRRLTPSELYDRYAQDLKGRSASAKSLQNALQSIVREQAYQGNEKAYVVHEGAWDSRWIHVFAEQDLTELVCVFCQEEDREITSYLTSKLKERARIQDYQTLSVLLALFRVGYKNATELLMELLRSQGQRTFYHIDIRLQSMIASLPKSYAPELRDIAGNMAYESVKEQMIELIEALEAAPDAAAEERGNGVWEWIKNKMS
ncbi:HEAT repeat domain-containing protein [Paenibacillus paeoniae]|uniref:HEAT repeat domain-containing protein n=1 Tax=Paenibacillus paeoniae TaxID=2292705 RepID=A0A371PL92_9BACL|nr:HEAT repeat domain-containing protein [Paenibacillus paeoniae]REK76755.1 HEAT repeat domain-containing protein [Paenibacillus paeoniae]